jgi:hypothetical protein
MTKTEAYPQLVEALDNVRRQWRLQKIAEGVLLALAGAGAVVLVLVAADNLLQPGTLGRALMAGLLWGSLAAALLTLVVRRFLEDRRDDFFAALVEQKHPELRNQLINALQLGRTDQPGFSPRLVEAIVLDASKATADLDMADSLDWRPALRAAGCLAAAVIFLILYAGLLTPRFVNGLSRMLAPLADIPPYTATQVVVKHDKDKDRVPEGASVPVEAKVSGVVPATATLYRRGGGAWQSTTLQPDKNAEDVFRFTVLQAAEPFDYYVAAGDGRSKQYHVEVVKRPQVEAINLTYTPPAYTGKPPQPVAASDGEISGLAGTRVAVELKASKPLHEASLKTQEGDVIALVRGADERTWAGTFAVWSDKAKMADGVAGHLVQAPTRYQIKLLDTDGYENADPLWRSIALVRDQAPTVALTAPGRDMQMQPGAKVSLAVEGRDDYGIDRVRVVYRVNDEPAVRELAHFDHAGEPQTSDKYDWDLSTGGLKAGDLVQYWAVATDRNTITGPGEGESRHFSLFLVAPEQVVSKLDLRIDDYVAVLEELVKLQRNNRAETASGVAFDALVKRQADIRGKTNRLARAMEKDALPVATVVKALDDLYAGLMAEAVKHLETGRDLDKAGDAAKAMEQRNASLPVQDRIIAQLQALLDRLQRNEQAREALRKIEKKDKTAFKNITKTLADMVQGLDKLVKEETQVAGKFERLPKKTNEELKEEQLKAMKDLDDLAKKAGEWAKGTVNELTKLPTGFVNDFKMRPDINKIYEEIEKAAQRAKAQKAEVALEDLGAGLATRMMEDLEMWMPDTPDNTKWVLEEPLNQKPMKIPEMPLPKALEDMVGDLLQKADEFDKDADDITSAWGDNLNQAGWGVSDGPISSFSAKGKTGNDLPNSHEVSGRSGDGRRGKSSGQMVGDTARGLKGRPTPARTNNERYEPGQLKQEGHDDPNGATGGGKKAGAGKRGLQGSSPPDMVRDIGRLRELQAGIRDKAEQVAHKLDTMGMRSQRLKESIELMKSVEQDLRDLRYDDAARKRREAVSKLHAAFNGLDDTTAAQLSKARDLPPQLRQELLQSADEGYPPGYESLLKSYYKALSTAEK